MASNSSKPHSIRFRNDLWAWLVDDAKARGLTPNEAVVELVEAARRGEGSKVVPPKPAKAAKVKAPAAAPAPVPRPATKFAPREDTYPAWMRKR